MIYEYKRIAAQIRVPDELLVTDAMAEVEARLRAMLNRWERLGFGISDLRMETRKDPATLTTMVMLTGLARLDGRPTEVEEQVERDIRFPAWDRMYLNPGREVRR